MRKIYALDGLWLIITTIIIIIIIIIVIASSSSSSSLFSSWSTWSSISLSSSTFVLPLSPLVPLFHGCTPVSLFPPCVPLFHPPSPDLYTERFESHTCYPVRRCVCFLCVWVSYPVRRWVREPVLRWVTFMYADESSSMRWGTYKCKVK